MVQQITTELSGAATENEKVAVITKGVFRLLHSNANNSSQTSENLAFNANVTGMQACEVRKQLQDLKTDMALLSETYLKPHMIVKTGTKAELSWQLRKASLTDAQTYFLSFQ
jgi:hypothetical protein